MLKNKVSNTNNKLKYLMLFIIILMTSISIAQNQPRSYVKISGNVKHEKKNLSGVSIEIYDGPTKSGTVKSNSIGKFRFNLTFDKIYIVVFKKAGFTTKKVEINTFVEEKDVSWNYEFEMQMFEMITGLDISALNQPVAKIGYDESEGDFASNEAYSKSMQTKLNKIIAQLKDLKSKEYENLIASADNNFRNKNYKKAIELYDKSFDIDPYADYPEAQIIKCEKLLRTPVVNEEDYKRVILLADKSFNNKDYEKAIGFYEEAMDIDPYADYPDLQVDKCEDLLAKLKDINKNYNNAINKADKFFVSKNYENAKKEYNSALTIKPEETYPKNKITQIDKLLAQKDNDEAAAAELAAKEAAAAAALASKEKLDADYNKLIASADGMFKGKKYNEAKNKYNEALKLKQEQYPKDKISEIDKLIAERKAAEKEAADLAAKEAAAAVLAAKAKLDTDYNNLIASADGMFKSKNYTGAKTKYQNALSKKPDETYPKDKISEIDKILADEAVAKQKEADFQKIIASADALLDAKKYKESKTKYIAASKIKSNDYTKGRIAQLDKLIAEQEKQDNINSKYNTAISEAGTLYDSKKYIEAKVKYNEALKVKPTSSFAKSRIKNIDVLLSQQQNNKKYDAEIKKADALFNAKKYTEAKASYLTASKLKTSEKYPKQKIAEIQKLIYDKNMNKPVETKPKDELANLASMSKETKQKYLSELSKKYPNRKTVEHANGANGTKITRIIINETGSAAHEYRKLEKSWGGVYYYKDGSTISEIIFYNETK